MSKDIKVLHNICVSDLPRSTRAKVTITNTDHDLFLHRLPDRNPSTTNESQNRDQDHAAITAIAKLKIIQTAITTTTTAAVAIVKRIVLIMKNILSTTTPKVKLVLFIIPSPLRILTIILLRILTTQILGRKGERCLFIFVVYYFDDLMFSRCIHNWYGNGIQLLLKLKELIFWKYL